VGVCAPLTVFDASRVRLSILYPIEIMPGYSCVTATDSRVR